MRATDDYVRIMTAALSTQSGVQIREGKDWFTDVRTRVVTYNMDDVRNLPFNIVRGLILHEMGHVLFTEVFDLSPEAQKYIDKYGLKTMQNVFNMFEDIRITRQLNYKFGRFSEFALRDVDYYSILKKFNYFNGDFTKVPKWTQFIFLAYLMYAAQYDDDVWGLVGGPDLDYILEKYYSESKGIKFDQEVIDLMKKHSGDVRNTLYQVERSPKASDCERTVCINIVPLLEKLLDQDPKAQPQPQPQKGQGSGGMQKQQGQGQSQKDPNQDQNQDKDDKQDGKGGKDNKDDKQDGKDKEGDGQDKKDEGKDDKEQQGDNQDDKQEEKEDDADKLLNCASHTAHEEKSMGEMMDGTEIPGKYGSKMKGLFARRSISHPTENEARALLKPWTNVLSNRLRDILTEKAATRWTGAHKSGKLLGKNAFKVSVADEARIFSKRNNPDTPMYSVYIALDGSGSMGSQSRALHAFMGSALLKEVCQQLRFDLHIYEYGERVRELQSLDKYTHSGGNTNDLEPLLEINKVIDSSKENLIFFITDGEPDPYTHREFTTVWNKMKREKNVTLYGIGIGSDLRATSMAKNYEIGVSVPKVEDLPMELVRIMRNTIHR